MGITTEKSGTGAILMRLVRIAYAGIRAAVKYGQSRSRLGKIFVSMALFRVVWPPRRHLRWPLLLEKFFKKYLVATPLGRTFTSIFLGRVWCLLIYWERGDRASLQCVPVGCDYVLHDQPVVRRSLIGLGRPPIK